MSDGNAQRRLLIIEDDAMFARTLARSTTPSPAVLARSTA